jgi:hypothetical protein
VDNLGDNLWITPLYGVVLAAYVHNLWITSGEYSEFQFQTAATLVAVGSLVDKPVGTGYNVIVGDQVTGRDRL